MDVMSKRLMKRWYSSCSIAMHLIVGALIMQQVSNTSCKSFSQDLKDSKWFDEYYIKEKKTTDTSTWYRSAPTLIYSRASKKNIRIMENEVDGRGSVSSKYARLIIESDNFGRVRIRGEETGKYLCVSKRGKLMARKDGKHRKRCVFHEIFSPQGYFEFVNVGKDGYHISISRKGSSRAGSKTTSGMKSVEFIKRPLPTMHNAFRTTYVRKLKKRDKVIKSTIKKLETLKEKLSGVERAITSSTTTKTSEGSLSERTTIVKEGLSLSEIIKSIDESLEKLRSVDQKKSKTIRIPTEL